MMGGDHDSGTKQRCRTGDSASFCCRWSAAGAVAILSLRHSIEPAEAKSATPKKEVKIVEFSDVGQQENTVTLPVIIKTDAEWNQHYRGLDP